MEPPTKTTAEKKFDLEERLLDFSVRIIRVTEQTPKTDAGRHVADQVFRSGTSPYANHGEAEAAESTNDFVHKLKLCLKELRETWRWLRLIQRVPMVPKPELLDPLIKEADELIRIFRQSIITCQRRNSKEGRT
jgi:four helix bundle protein